MTRADQPLQRHITEHLDRIADELADNFHGIFSPATVARCVYETYVLLDAHATVTTHLMTLTARLAKDRLTDDAHATGLVHATAPRVLFVCVHNVGRSQLAAALLDHHAFGRVTIRSAGSQPRGEIPATIIDALGELGVGLPEAYPKPLTDEMVRAADVVVTMGCGDTCPIYPGKRYLDWQVDDPADAPIDKVRYIRDDLDRRVRDLLAELLREW